MQVNHFEDCVTRLDGIVDMALLGPPMMCDTENTEGMNFLVQGLPLEAASTLWLPSLRMHATERQRPITPLTPESKTVTPHSPHA